MKRSREAWLKVMRSAGYLRDYKEIFMETTPYGIKPTPQGFEVWQMWHDRKVSGPFTTREQAEAEAIRIKKENR